MRFTEETRQNLAAAGITISNTLMPEEQYRQAVYNRYHSDLECYYHKKEFVNGEYATVKIDHEGWDKKTEDWTEEYLNANPMDSWRGRWYESTELYIRKGDMMFKRTVGKSKLITEEYVLGVVSREEKAYSGVYGQFAKDVNKMFQKQFPNEGGWIYPTTYGIGVWVFCNWKSDECIGKVEEVLKSLGVEYRNEFSKAFFVYRFVISKAYVNRTRLN